MRHHQEARAGLADHIFQQGTETIDIGVIERRVHFVEHADRCRVAHEHREDERECRQRLLAA